MPTPLEFVGEPARALEPQAPDVRPASASARNWLLQMGESGRPGHRLLPLWPHLVSALPQLGMVCTVSRNHHVILGGRCQYPGRGGGTATNDQRFHHDFDEWKDGWFYHESLHDSILASIEFRDGQGLGFHKVMLTDGSDLTFAQTLLRAFEDEALTQEDVAEAVMANHLDGACCPNCEARARAEGREWLPELKAFIEHAIEVRKPVRAMLFHPGLVTMRRFVPEVWCPKGLWVGVAGEDTQMFFRPSGFGSLKFSRLDPGDRGPCSIAAIRKQDGDMLATLIIED